MWLGIQVSHGEEELRVLLLPAAAARHLLLLTMKW
jgi:hypothetical protein